MSAVEVVIANPENIAEFSFCGFKDQKKEGYQKKLAWFKQRFEEGLVYKILRSKENGDLGFIEYVPAEHSWRAVEAPGYMMIHCVFMGKRAYKEKGYASMLVRDCIEDSDLERKKGVAVVTSSRTFMAGHELFEKLGFENVDTAPPCFQLMALKFDDKAELPKFPADWTERLNRYSDGLTLLYSDQCPYVHKWVGEIVEAAAEFNVEVKLEYIDSSAFAQNAPTAYGTYALIYNGELIADHPVSKRRFQNIMKKLLG